MSLSQCRACCLGVGHSQGFCLGQVGYFPGAMVLSVKKERGRKTPTEA